MMYTSPVPRLIPLSHRPALLVILLMLALTALLRVPMPPVAVPAALAPAAAPQVHGLPLSFVPNQDQSDGRVRFETHGLDAGLFFSATAIDLRLRAAASGDDRATSLPPETLQLSFDGAQPSALVGVEQQPGVVNYLRGNDPSRWRTGIPTYGGIVYQQLYPGIDLRYDGQHGTDSLRLKGTYTVAPHADPTLIRWRYVGARTVERDAAGNLAVTLANGRVLTDAAPISWQMIDGRCVPVTSSYQIASHGSLSFALGVYDPTRPLIIDPTLSFSTLVYQSEQMAIDSAGNVYLTGTTYDGTAGFPLVNPLDDTANNDAFVLKLDPSRTTVLYGTFLGGDRRDEGSAIALDSAANIYVTGLSFSDNFPTVDAFQFDPSFYLSFVSKISPTPPNLIANGGFETDADNNTRPDRWSVNEHVTRNATLVHSGSAAMRHAATNDASYSIFSDSTSGVVPGAAYSVGSWVNIPPTSDQFQFEMQVRWRDAANNVISTVPIKTFSAATSGWTDASATLLAPPNAALVSVRMVVSSLKAMIYVDDVDVRRLVNRQTNSSFEQECALGINQFRHWSADPYTSCSDVRRSGRFAMRHQASDNASYAIFSDGVQAIKPGNIYSVSGWINIPPTTDQFSFAWQVRWRDADSNVISTVTLPAATAATNGWTHLAGSVVAPPNATQATLRQVVSSLNATIYVDVLEFGP